MDDKTLIEALIKKSLLLPESGQKLLTEAAQVKQPVEALIYGRRLVDEVEVAKVKSELLGIPYKPVDFDKIPDDLLKLIPEETAQTYRVIPLSRDAKMLVIGMVNPSDTRAQEALRFIAKQNRISLGVYIVTPSDLELVLQRYHPYQSEVQSALSSLNIKPGKNEVQRIIQIEEGSSVSEDAPIIKIVASTLRSAVEENASDIHIEPQRSRLRIRFRTDGILKEVASLPLELAQPVVSRVKVLSSLKIDETRIPQDGRFRTVVFGRDIDFRVSTFPTPAGEKVAIRVLDPTVGLKGVDNLGLVGRNSDLVTSALKRPYGMILVTGPTGSGKTTTLYALLQVLNTEAVNILSLEDPVEYFVDGLNQSQVRPEIGYDFASGLRQIVRQDPDVIMVGEIRDTETAKLAVQAALTGQIVLSTLHTNNAVGVIPRLVDMGVESFLLPTSLNLMVSQRLVRRLCDSCKKAEEATPDMQELIEKELGLLPTEARKNIKYSKPFKIYHAPGCKVCKGKGAIGRIALFEVMTMTRELEEAVASGVEESKIID
ncbi:MAG: Flp pilus assembly complex ATPase component TadA, partial [Patescibacteria group bacterium]|nr:Flp pilus assembly complex ATPase component TadA [Patescibacteria group bacterium]